MTRKLWVLGSILLVGFSACAQDFPRAEIAVLYSYSRFAPAARYTPGMNLNGGGGEVTINFNEHFGLTADLTGFGASKATFTIPAGDPLAPGGATITASGNMFLYVFGPQFSARSEKINPYFHALFGGAHSTLYANAYANCAPGLLCYGAGKPSQDAFAMALGGGFDVRVSRAFAIRIGQFDYLLTRFTNRLATNNQNNFRYSAGVVFTFGNNY